MDTAIDGQPAAEMQVIGMLRLLLIAGIDTTWSAIGAALWHLAEHPEDAARLRAEPALLPTAIEELLRAYAPVTMAREVIEGHRDQRLPDQGRQHGAALLPRRQPRPCDFPEPDRVILDRAENRHAAFGLGHPPMRRQQPRADGADWWRWQTFLQRVPAFRVSGPVRWAVGTVRGPRTLPMSLSGELDFRKKSTDVGTKNALPYHHLSGLLPVLYLPCRPLFPIS